MTADTTTAPRLRPITPADHAAVLALNHAHAHLLAPMTETRLRQLLGWTDRADVIDVGGTVAGFVLTFAPGTDYDSPNYREFTARYVDRFYYLDRIAIDPAFRRRGLASMVYDEVEAVAAGYGRLVLEVNLRPPNHQSLAFHRGRGFNRVGELGDSAKAVALLTKEMG